MNKKITTELYVVSGSDWFPKIGKLGQKIVRIIEAPRSPPPHAVTWGWSHTASHRQAGDIPTQTLSQTVPSRLVLK